MKGALINGCFTEKAKRNSICFLVLRRKRDAGSQRDLSAYNGVAAEKIDPLVEHVHRSALAARTTARLAIQLRHHCLGRDAFGDRLSMLTIARQHVIVFAQRRNRTDTDGLLPGGLTGHELVRQM